MKIRCNQKKKDYETFYTNLMVTTRQKSRTEIPNIKMETVGKNTENQIKRVDRDTKEKK